VAKHADEYCRYAQDAERRAEKIHDPVAKETYRDIAAKWRQIAEQGERWGQ
jgi:hypothetical protein